MRNLRSVNCLLFQSELVGSQMFQFNNNTSCECSNADRASVQYFPVTVYISLGAQMCVVTTHSDIEMSQ